MSEIHFVGKTRYEDLTYCKKIIIPDICDVCTCIWVATPLVGCFPQCFASNYQSPMTTRNNASLRLIDYFEDNHHVSIDEKDN